jgi:hypothetical protein
MLAVMCAKWVGDAFSKSIYDEQLELKSITFLDVKPPKFTHCKIVSEVMKGNAVSFKELESLENLIAVSVSHHISNIVDSYRY